MPLIHVQTDDSVTADVNLAETSPEVDEGPDVWETPATAEETPSVCVAKGRL